MVSNRRKRKILGCFLLFATPIDGLLGVTSAPSLTRKKRRHSKWSFLTSPSSTTRATLRSGKSSWLEAAPHRQVNTNASSPPTESLSSSPATSVINTNSPTSSASSDARHTDSPLSQIYEDDEHPRAPRPPPSSFSRNEDWLESVTGELLDLDVYPLGKLTDDDVESIAGLMAAWARRKSVTAALTVERLLKRVVDDLKEGNQRVHVTTRMYSCAIDAWAKSGVEGSCERAAQIHDTLVQHYQSTNDPLLAPSVMSFNTVVNAWAKSNHDDAPAKAEAVLEEMIQAYRNGNEALKPDAVTFSTILDAYSKSNKPNAVARCYELFQVMDELDVKRNVYTFSALQNVVARSRIPNAAEQTMNILQQMLKLYENGDVFAKPNTLNYNAVLNACSRTPSKASAQLADDLLHSMELPLIQGGYDVEPDRLSYAMCILACARCPDETFGVPKAEANLRRMESRAIMEAAKRQQISSAAPPTVTLDIECFNVVLTALSRRKNIPPTRTLEIVKRMEEYAEQGQEHLRPNVRSWNAVLNAYARAIAVSSHSTASNSYAQMAAEFLQHMRLDLGIRPDAFSFAALLSAFQKWDHPEAVAQADALVREMESLFEQNEIDAPPDVYHYTILCGAWARSGQKIAPQRCLQILAHMVERHRLGYPNVKPNVRTYNAVLDCLARAGAEDRAEQLLFHMLKLYRDGDHDAEPDAFTFNCIIHAFSKSRRKGAGRRAESILDRFLEYHEEENQSIRPDTRSFTHIIAHYGRSRELDAPYRAEYVLNRMVSLCKDGNKDLAPNLFAIKTVVDSYSHAKHPDAGRNAERFLNLIRELREKHGITRLERDTSFMNSVLFAWSSCGSEDSGHRAEGHLLEMEDSFDQGTISFRPDSRSYEMVLSAWAKSESSDKAKRALLTLRRMQEQQRTGNPFVRIDEAAYSFVINACAFSNAGEDLEAEAFTIAVKLLDEMLESKSVHPSSLTYGWFIQACGRLRVAHALKSVQIGRAFHLCCENGLVNDFVLHRLKGAAPDPVFKELLAPVLSNLPPRFPKGRLAVNNLPSDWTCNVDGNRKIRRQ